jgi:hypothetical protein
LPSSLLVRPKYDPAPHTNDESGDDTADALRDEIKTFTDAVKTPKGQQIPVGAAFLGWYLDAGHKDLLIAALELKVKAVFFAFSDHMDRWVNFVRGYDEVSRAPARTQ